MAIHFHLEDIEYNLSDKKKHSNWLCSIVKNEGMECGNINIIFCSDDFLLKLNNQFLNHDYFTDIITFDYCEDNIAAGDLFISIDRINENAQKFNCQVIDELRRVMAHGILHLTGYQDKDEDNQVIMKQKEELYLSKFN